MIIGIGIDIISISRIRLLLHKHGSYFENRFFSDHEVASSKGADVAGYYAKRFAAKEAFLKAVGTGMARGFSWREIEVVRNGAGAPSINLLAGSRDTLHSIHGNVTIFTSLSDERHGTVECAVSCVVLEGG